MVMVLPAKEANTPPGNPVAAPIPVAPVVVWVMLVSAVLMQSVGDAEEAPTVLSGVTVTVTEFEYTGGQSSVPPPLTRRTDLLNWNV